MATPGNVGIMLLSLLVTDRLSEIDERMIAYLSLRPNPHPRYYGAARSDRCPFTGQKDLYRALKVLLHPDFDDLVHISVEPAMQRVHLETLNPDGPSPCTFGNIDGVSWSGIQRLTKFNDIFGLSQDLRSWNEQAGAKGNRIAQNLESD